jgi:hypothetical protein
LAKQEKQIVMKILFVMGIVTASVFTETMCNRKPLEIAYDWLNLKYVKCLQTRLPCDCEEFTETFYSLTLDTSRYSKNFGVALWRFKQMEAYQYQIKKISFSEFEILKPNEPGVSWAKPNY